MKFYKKYLDKKIPDLTNKTYIVTGANSGIGLNTTRALVYKNARVIMACRNLVKANEAKKKILNDMPTGKINIIEYNQGDFVSIKEFAKIIQNEYSNIDGIILNAGVYYPKQNYKTYDGFELTFGINYLGVYVLLNELREYFNKCHTRIVFVNSLVSIYAKKINMVDNENLSRNKSYGYSKYCISRLFYEYDSLNQNFTCRMAHPGVTSTNIISSEQTGLPNWISILGHRFLTLFTHPSSKACLCEVTALVSNEKNHYVTPRGLFSISGYPHCKKSPKFIKKAIIKETEEYLKNKYESNRC